MKKYANSALVYAVLAMVGGVVPRRLDAVQFESANARHLDCGCRAFSIVRGQRSCKREGSRLCRAIRVCPLFVRVPRNSRLSPIDPAGGAAYA